MTLPSPEPSQKMSGSLPRITLPLTTLPDGGFAPLPASTMTTPPENGTSPLGLLFLMTLPNRRLFEALTIATPMPESGGVPSSSSAGQKRSFS